MDLQQGAEHNTMDISGQADGSNQKGRMTSTSEGTLTNMVVAGKMYGMGDVRFWTSSGVPSAEAHRRVGKYLVKVATPTKTARTYLAESLGEFDDAAGQSTTHPATYQGEAAIKVTSTSDPGYWFAVTADPSHRPLEAHLPGADMTFSSWNAVTPFTAPPASQIYGG
ncbi:hypothetical protein VV01_20980 [Luteipulveratus halotolerans]|uniref:Uncharacterized protein n=2 Tax=Luteipulveratus halotolerans TaxID=1631356 RepID=A0A0L6CMT2_9MICO|nr:hypothetical protein VV01_20980 [Luteipulveratus halotolerans]